MNTITIKPLTPELNKDYLDFFDNRTQGDGSTVMISTQENRPFVRPNCTLFNSWYNILPFHSKNITSMYK